MGHLILVIYWLTFLNVSCLFTFFSPVIVPMWVDICQLFGYSVMLSQPQSVHCGQSGLFIASKIPSSKTMQISGGNPTFFIGCPRIQCWQKGFPNVQVRILQFTYSTKS